MLENFWDATYNCSMQSVQVAICLTELSILFFNILRTGKENPVGHIILENTDTGVSVIPYVVVLLISAINRFLKILLCLYFHRRFQQAIYSINLSNG
jgi:hypothetical protein